MSNNIEKCKLIAAELMKPDCQQTSLVVNYEFWFDVFPAIGTVVRFLTSISSLMPNGAIFAVHPSYYLKKLSGVLPLPGLFVHTFYRNLTVWDFFFTP